ncbi:unnamed protein product, partial [Ectocarpus sp. 4 AP-2014]
MTPRLSTIALLCCAVGWRYTPTLEADAFVAPPLVVDNRGGVAARSPPRQLESSSPGERHAAPTAARPAGTRNHGEQRQRQQQQRLTMASSRLNGADVSEDLTQVNGAAAMPPPVAANTARTAQQRGFPATLSLGAPRHRPGTDGYTTKGNVEVSCKVMDVPHAEECVEDLVQALDARRGVLLTSSYEFPGRYARWTLGFSDPPLELSGTGRDFRVRALNDSARCLPPFSQEERSKQPSLFSVVRAAVDLFYYEGDPQLGLYGAFGYDLTFQFDSIPLKHERDGSQKDLLLYLPDKMLVVDQARLEFWPLICSDKRDAWSIEYDFAYGGATTEGLPREGEVVAYKPSDKPGDRDTPPGDYAKKVDKAKEEFKVGNLFEVVLSQTFKKPCTSSPAKVFRRLRKRNPSPYGFLINLGDQEYLVGASPEMFVRCERTRHGIRVETCPISGTIERGANPLEDAQKIRSLLSNKKEESELTMCTDVDR